MSDSDDTDQASLPETSPNYPDPITDPICVACGKKTGEICVCFGCQRRIQGLQDDGLEAELVKAYARGRAAEYWDTKRSVRTGRERGSDE